MLGLHLLFFTTFLALIDIATHRIPRELIYLGLATLVLFVDQRSFGLFILAIALPRMVFALISIVNPTLIGKGDRRLSSLIGGYIFFAPNIELWGIVSAGLLQSTLTLLSLTTYRRGDRIAFAPSLCLIIPICATTSGALLR